MWDREYLFLKNMRFIIIKSTIGNEKYNQGKYKEAVEIFNKMSTSETFEEFLTLPAYDLL